VASRAFKKRPGATKKYSLAGGLSVLAVVAALCICVGVGMATMINSWFTDLPDYEKADAFNTSMPTYVYASDRETVLARFQLEAREPVEMSDISQSLVDAVIAIEDARFYEHSGIDYYGVMRALINNLTGGSIEGASTITQQFVRNTILADEMDEISIKRKVREAYIALQLEEMYNKDTILLMYLNTINFGAGAHGVEVAAKRYFSKHASELTLTEAALLAGIPQSPTYNDPLQYPDHALERRNLVLGRMLGEHYITQEEYDKAIQEPLGLNPSDITDDGIIAYPYFTSYVRYLLYNNYDLSEADILKGGLKVYTTLDVGKQNDAEAACAAKRDSMWNDSMEVAMAVVDPNTGNVQAIVGGSDYSVSQVNLATGQGGGGRPCGSVFKTFTLVESIKKAINPNATYLDCTSPATVDGYTLENYANTSYGTRSVAGAFAVSSNTGFVRLISSIGVKDVANTAHDLGITSDLHEDEAGPTLTLGVENVTPLELANAVATIANGGVRHDLCAISTIEDREGNVIVDDSDPEKRATRVLTPEQARAIQDVMRGVVTGGTGMDAAMWNGQPVAGKTGTSENYKDISFVGYTPFTAAAIWVGDPTNMSAVPTGSAGDVFRNYATAMMEREGVPVQDFPEADYPEFQPYDDVYYHVTSGYAYYYDPRQYYDTNKEKEENDDSDDAAEEADDSPSEPDDDSGSTEPSSDSGSKKKKKT
jgi:penicillin-binding protein 1A